jgi:DNA gyrase/topoisomerase IV subunit A
MIKRTNINTLGISKLSKISTIMSLQPNDEIVSCIISSSIDNVNEKVCTITRNGMSLLYPTSQISIVSKNAAGVNNINLKNDDIVVSTFLLDELKDYVSVISTQGFKRINRTMLPLSNRSRSGS